MSDLYRSAMSARIAKLPEIPHTEADEDEESADSLGSLPGSGLGPPALPAHTRRNKQKHVPDPEFAPISASTFFVDAAQVEVPSRNLDCRIYYTPPKFADGTVMVCHHGAGYSGLSFACFAKEISDITKDECGVLALDARRHGKTTTSQTDDDLSIDVLVEDFIQVIKTVFPEPQKAPTLLLVGHSMGGSVVVRACPVFLDLKYRVAGVAVIDVVEGSALDALPHMNSLLNARPDGFDSPEEAIEWHVNTKAVRNPKSARVSIPVIIKPSGSDSPLVPKYIWRTPLRSTAPYWKSWFEGLSSKFLAARTARLLVLAGTDRLDKELMIGQMQGKFQLVVVPGVGHMLQEDDPTGTARILIDFWTRNEQLVAGIKKVGEI
ncbi:Alpha/Beta hydrolase protein [Desarmillaria ectypa]|nr:Alpha/Beta hydrolase protein [Desarmillaria ectypa]